jgi:uracil-DNA glycosylase family 4
MTKAGKTSRKKAWEALNQDITSCERCPRLRRYCQGIAREKKKAFMDWKYWGKPVANFGDPQARFLIVGLAPAAHGANRTGRMFTGDRSGDWLYRALERAGFANQARAESADDGLELFDCAITATAHCAPPDNKPEPIEIARCEEYLSRTFELLDPVVIMALGGIAWKAIGKELKAKGLMTKALPPFAHGTVVDLGGGRSLIASYHPSQQNTFTGRLTEPMFDSVFSQVRELLAHPSS